MQRGEIGLAQTEVEILIEECRHASGSGPTPVAVLFYRAMLALMRGELAEAEGLIVQSMALVRHAGSQPMRIS